MFITIKKKNIVYAMVAVFFVIAAYINFGTGSDEIDDSMPVASEIQPENPRSADAVMVSSPTDKLQQAKSDREIVRSKACELFRNTINDSNVSQDAKKKAEDGLIKMAENMDKESECEAALVTKGFEESCVFISDNGVSVSVLADELTQKDVARINDLIYAVTSINNIRITAIK